MVDAVMLEEVLTHIHNWFRRDAVAANACSIVDGQLPTNITAEMIEGQWYRVEGSYLNDGLHLHPATDLSDETFDGTITLLAIPRPLLKVVEDISSWQDANGAAVDGPYASESFGGYSYQLKTDSAAGSASGGLSGWRLAFRDRLNPWRRMFD